MPPSRRPAHSAGVISGAPSSTRRRAGSPSAAVAVSRRACRSGLARGLLPLRSSAWPCRSQHGHRLVRPLAHTRPGCGTPCRAWALADAVAFRWSTRSPAECAPAGASSSFRGRSAHPYPTRFLICPIRATRAACVFAIGRTTNVVTPDSLIAATRSATNDLGPIRETCSSRSCGIRFSASFSPG